MSDWEIVDLTSLIPTALPSPGPRPVTLAVDGRSAAGKTSLAHRLAGAVTSATVVHTDDVAWHTAMFDWAELMEGGLLAPISRGCSVRLRPPAWIERGRPGSINVPATTELLVIEGAGSGRREFARYIDVLIWMQGDPDQLARREQARIARGEVTAEFVEEWSTAERAFFEKDRPWERATFIVSSTGPTHSESRIRIARRRPERQQARAQ